MQKEATLTLHPEQKAAAREWQRVQGGAPTGPAGLGLQAGPAGGRCCDAQRWQQWGKAGAREPGPKRVVGQTDRADRQGRQGCRHRINGQVTRGGGAWGVVWPHGRQAEHLPGWGALSRLATDTHSCQPVKA